MAPDDIDERRVEGDDGGSADPSRDSEGPSGGAVDAVDGRIVDLLAWILDTETRAKIYVYLLANPGSTSEEVATGTGLYPSTVREALAELHEEEKVSREKRASEGAGNNPYEYNAIQPSELVGGVVDQVQQELNTIFTLDRILDRGSDDELDDENVEPVTITVDDELEEELDGDLLAAETESTDEGNGERDGGLDLEGEGERDETLEREGELEREEDH